MKSPDGGLPARFLASWHRLERKEGGRVKLVRFGELLGQVTGSAVAASTVARWEKGAIPDLVSVVAIARVCGVHPAWLAFGLGEPDDPVVGEITVLPIEEPPAVEETPVFPKAKRGKKYEPAVPSKRKAAPRRASGDR